MGGSPGRRLAWLFVLAVIVWLHFAAFLWIFLEEVIDNNDKLDRVIVSKLLIPFAVFFGEMIVFILVNIVIMFKDLHVKQEGILEWHRNSMGFMF